MSEFDVTVEGTVVTRPTEVTNPLVETHSNMMDSDRSGTHTAKNISQQTSSSHMPLNNGIEVFEQLPSETDILQSTEESVLVPSPPIPLKRAFSEPTTSNERSNARETLSPRNSGHNTAEVATCIGSEAIVTSVGGGGQLRGSRSSSFAGRAIINDNVPLASPRTPPRGRYPHLHSVTPSQLRRSPTALYAPPQLSVHPPNASSSSSLTPSAPQLQTSSQRIPAINPQAATPAAQVIEDVFNIINTVIGAVTDNNSSSNNAQQTPPMTDIETGLVTINLDGLTENSNVSSMYGGNVVETFNCSICFENRSKLDAFTVTACDCKHVYCLPCMSSYATILVDDGVVDHYCPGVAECHALLTAEELRVLLFPEAFAKLERLTQVKKNPLYRECPVCNTGISAVTQTQQRPSASALARLSLTTPQQGDKIEVPVAKMTCTHCSHVFCFYHDNAHPGISCSEYARRQSRRARRENAASEALVNTTTRPCPHCGSPTEKAGGCNHMTCKHCRCNWCWLCSSVMTDVTEHYKRGNIFGCPGAQFIDTPMRIDPFSGCCRCFSWCLGWSCWNSQRCLSFRNVMLSIYQKLKICGRLLLLLIVLPPAMAAGLSCWCGCLPLMCTGILIWVKCKCGYKLKRAFKNELWFPMVAGALLVLFLFDLCFLWIPGLLYLLGWCVTRIRFGAEATRLMQTNEQGEAEPFCKLFLNYLASMSVTAWICNMLDG